MNINRLRVRWTKDLNIEKALDYEDKLDEFFYMVLRKRRYKEGMRYRILYIGMAYKQLSL